jgi:hypothetical protein
MADVNWSLGLPQQNPGNAFLDAFKQGQQQRRQDQARQAMGALVQNPNDPKALAALAQVDPQSAMEFRKQQIEYSKAQLAQHQDSILKGAEIVRQFNPKDQQSYTAALQAAQAAGIDVSQVPQQYNPQYVDGVMKLADALKPQTSDNTHFITPQPGGGAYAYDPRTGGVTTIIAPNPGDQAPGAPVQAGGLPHVSDQRSYDAIPPGTQYMTPDGHVRVKQGGQPVAPAGGFP